MVVTPESHYKVPLPPRPVSTFKPSSPSYVMATQSISPPDPPSVSAPWIFSAGSVAPNIRPTVIPVKPPQVPTHFTETGMPATIKTSNISCNVCTKCKASNGITSTSTHDYVKKALNELSELINFTTTETTNESSVPLSQPSPSSSFSPGYVQPISSEWEDINRKLSMLVISMKAQNKKIDDIRRICTEKSDYVSFDDLKDFMAPSDFTPDQQSPMPPKYSTLPYVPRSNTDTRTGRSWGRKLINCVKFGKK
jgi:hypothetical protein